MRPSEACHGRHGTSISIILVGEYNYTLTTTPLVSIPAQSAPTGHGAVRAAQNTECALLELAFVKKRHVHNPTSCILKLFKVA